MPKAVSKRMNKRDEEREANKIKIVTVDNVIWSLIHSIHLEFVVSFFPEAGFLVRVHPDTCLILIRVQIRALLCSSKSKFIRAQTTLTLQVLNKKTGLKPWSF
jgi:hypothetical protein